VRPLQPGDDVVVGTSVVGDDLNNPHAKFVDSERPASL
jgi:hypothetical protein